VLQGERPRKSAQSHLAGGDSPRLRRDVRPSSLLEAFTHGAQPRGWSLPPARAIHAREFRSGSLPSPCRSCTGAFIRGRIKHRCRIDGAPRRTLLRGSSRAVPEVRSTGNGGPLHGSGEPIDPFRGTDRSVPGCHSAVCRSGFTCKPVSSGTSYFQFRGNDLRDVRPPSPL